MNGAANVGMKPEDVGRFKIPLLPLEDQRKIASELNQLKKITDGAKQILNNYTPRLRYEDSWKKVELKNLASVESGSGFPLQYQDKKDGKYPFLKVSDMNLVGNETEILSWNNSVSETDVEELGANILPKGSIIFPKVGGAIATNKKRILTVPSIVDNNVMALVPIAAENAEYLYFWLLGVDLTEWASKSVPPSIRKTTVEQALVPLPQKEELVQATATMRKEQDQIYSAKTLANSFEEKIQNKLTELWNV
jgi:restriction endonuclease S subunit